MVISQSTDSIIQKIWNILEMIPDPEIPVINIIELGIVRNVAFENDRAIVTITPTYSGCPAMDMISVDIRINLEKEGFIDPIINQIISPPWTTDWMTDKAKDKLKDYGIAPPMDQRYRTIQCPQCDSDNVELMSQHGSTPCKALYRCKNCLEPFDYFKCH